MVAQDIHLFSGFIVSEIHTIVRHSCRVIIITSHDNCKAVAMLTVIDATPLQVGFGQVDFPQTVSPARYV